MIRATIQHGDGRWIMFIGVEPEDLRRVALRPLKGAIRADGKELALGVDVVVFSGPNEEAMIQHLKKLAGPRKLHLKREKEKELPL